MTASAPSTEQTWLLNAPHIRVFQPPHLFVTRAIPMHAFRESSHSQEFFVQKFVRA
jgi:hypothetical protein